MQGGHKKEEWSKETTAAEYNGLISLNPSELSWSEFSCEPESRHFWSYTDHLSTRETRKYLPSLLNVSNSGLLLTRRGSVYLASWHVCIAESVFLVWLFLAVIVNSDLWPWPSNLQLHCVGLSLHLCNDKGSEGRWHVDLDSMEMNHHAKRHHHHHLFAPIMHMLWTLNMTSEQDNKAQQRTNSWPT